MGAWDESREHYDRAYGEEPHKAKLSHEMIAGGAAFAGFEMFEKHQRAEGKPVEHAFAKSLLAGFVGAEVDKLAETKGEDEWDRHKAKEHAKHHSERMYDEHYIDGHGADNYDPDRYGPPDFRREGGRGVDEYGSGHNRRDEGYDQGYGRNEQYDQGYRRDDQYDQGYSRNEQYGQDYGRNDGYGGRY